MESFVWTCKCSKSVSLLILGGGKNDQDTQYSHTSISRQPAACKEKRILTHASEQTVWTTASPCCLRSNTALSIYCSTAICARLLLTIKWSSDFLYSDLFLFFFSIDSAAISSCKSAKCLLLMAFIQVYCHTRARPCQQLSDCRPPWLIWAH